MDTGRTLRDLTLTVDWIAEAGDILRPAGYRPSQRLWQGLRVPGNCLMMPALEKERSRIWGVLGGKGAGCASLGT